MNNTYKRAIIGAGLGVALGLLAVGELGSFSPVSTKVNGKSLKVPAYSLKKVPPLHCARYVREAAKDIFNESIPAADAWNLRYSPEVQNVVSTNSSALNLESLAHQNNIRQGDMVGIYNPKSRYLNEKDKTGERVKYTHIGLYLGTNDFGEPMIAHQFGRKTLVDSYSDMTNRGLMPREIMRVKDRNELK